MRRSEKRWKSFDMMSSEEGLLVPRDGIYI